MFSHIWYWLLMEMPYSINLYADINCLTSVGLDVRCWIWNSETTCHSVEYIQILTFASLVIDINRISSIPGAVRLANVAHICGFWAKIVLWWCRKAVYASVRDFKGLGSEYSVFFFTLNVLLPCMEKNIWFGSSCFQTKMMH